jgi:hypothetical protein
VSQLIGEILYQKTEEMRALADTLRAMELERIDRMQLHWYQRAKNDIEAARVLLHWTERRHKLLGLDITKHELSGPGGGPVCVTASSLDFSKLSEEQLRQLEDRARRGATVTFRPRQPPIGTASSGENQANSIYLQHGDESCSVRSDPTAAEAPISVFFFVRREA